MLAYMLVPNTDCANAGRLGGFRPQSRWRAAFNGRRGFVWRALQLSTWVFPAIRANNVGSLIEELGRYAESGFCLPKIGIR